MSVSSCNHETQSATDRPQGRTVCRIDPGEVFGITDAERGSALPANRPECRRARDVPRCALQMLRRLVALPLLGLILFYRRVISPGLPPRCRFLPSCSEYAEQSIRRHGLIVGLARTTWRLARCHPFCKGGYDPP